jgi:short-subunit dehydrogenase
VADPSDAAQVADRSRQEAGPVDVLVNNAGNGMPGGVSDVPDDVLRMTTEVCYLAPAEFCRQVIPRLLRRGGHIVNDSSMAGTAVVPGLASYSAAKAALSHFMAEPRADYGGLPIGTTLVEVGPVPTDMLAQADDYAPTGKSFERFYRIGFFVDVPREKVAAEVVNAVQKGKRHVRLPRRDAAGAMLVEAPRRMMELVLTGVSHRP